MCSDDGKGKDPGISDNQQNIGKKGRSNHSSGTKQFHSVSVCMGWAQFNKSAAFGWTWDAHSSVWPKGGKT